MYNLDADHITSMAKEINASMTWSRTPQGAYYWGAVNKRLEAHAHCIRTGVIPSTGKVNIESKASGGDGKFAILTDTASRLMRVSADLNSMCAWSHTPEGSDYWADVSNSLVANAELLSKGAVPAMVLGVGLSPTSNQLGKRKRLLAYAYQQAAKSTDLVP